MAEPKQSSPIQPSSFTPLDPGGAQPGHTSHRGRWLLAAAAVIFVLAMLFLFSARALQIQVQSETPAEISVSGFALPFGGRYLVRPGSYQVDVTAAGYVPLRTTITVNDGDNQSITLVLQSLPGKLNITSTPPGATVSVNGKVLGETPLLELAAERGDVQLRLEGPRHLPLEETLHVTGRGILQQLNYKLDPAWANISISTKPEGATILLDGEAAGTTPATIQVLQGEHTVVLQLDNFAPLEQTLLVQAGKARDLGTLQLEPAAGTLELSSNPAGANVTLDGEFRGNTPLVLALTPGREHQLALFKAGYRQFTDTVRLDAAGSELKTINLVAQTGEVRFRIKPDNALLRINGKSYGTGDQTLSLPAMAHKVEVSLAGYAPVQRRVTPRPGLAQQIDITLLTQKAARLARTPARITSSLGQAFLLFNPVESSQAQFTMGASRREPGRRANEVLRTVTLSRMFYLQTTEVTNAQFRQYQADHKSGQVSGKSLNREQQPVVQISWQQAASFCNWLSQRDGLPPFYLENQGIIVGFDPSSTGYRLPTEAEWAWAARTSGKQLLIFPWSGTFPPTVAVENYADAGSAYITGRVLNNYNDKYVLSAPVASFGPNQHGLFDMGGNVAEWVHDVYTIAAADAPPLRDPLGAQNGDNYVVRGASWAHARRTELRLSYRDYGQAGRDDVGFRIARYAE